MKYFFTFTLFMVLLVNPLVSFAQANDIAVLKKELSNYLDRSTTQSLDSFKVELDQLLEQALQAETAHFVDTLERIELEHINNLYENIFNQKESFYTWASSIIGVLTLALTIIIGLGIFTQVQRTRDAKQEAMETTQKEERLANRIKDADQKFDEVQKLRQQLIDFINREREEITRREDELKKQLNEFDVRNRAAFHSLHNDLIEFCMDISESASLNSDSNEDLMEYYRSTLYEHQSILQLYSVDISKVHKTLQSLSVAGSARALPHLDYLIQTRLENWEQAGEDIDLINQVKKLTYRTIVNIEENS